MRRAWASADLGLGASLVAAVAGIRHVAGAPFRALARASDVARCGAVNGSIPWAVSTGRCGGKVGARVCAITGRLGRRLERFIRV